MSVREDAPPLLIRDLAQVASPAGSNAPLRGASLRDIDVTPAGYVLCRDGKVEQVGRMAELGPIDGDVEELDGLGL